MRGRTHLGRHAALLLDLLERIAAEAVAAGRKGEMPFHATIGAALTISPNGVRPLLRQLEDAGQIENVETPVRGHHPGSWRLVKTGAVLLHGHKRSRGEARHTRTLSPASIAKPKRSEDEVKVRTCLRCRDTFLSQHFGNRLCEACKSWASTCAGEAFAVSASPLERVGRAK